MNYENKGNRIFVLFILLVLITLCFQLFKIPSSARTYPTVLLAGSFILGFIILVSKQEASEVSSKLVIKDTVIFLSLIIIHIILLTVVGYIISTVLFLYASLYYLKTENKIVKMLFPIIVTLIMYLFFSKVLHVFLPEGSLINIYF